MHTNLPTHPRTGLTALGFRKPRAGEDGPQPIWPVMGGSQPTGEPAPASAPPAAPTSAPPAPAAPAPATPPIPTPSQVFPPAAQPAAQGQQPDTSKSTSTPWRELPLEDQVDYWRAQSRRHESRQLAALGLKPGELDQLRSQASASQQTYQAELTAAEQRGRTAAQADFGLQLADAHLRMAIGDRMSNDQVNGLLTHLNLGQFLTDQHQVDADKVSQFVALLPAAPAQATPPAQDPATAGDPAAAPATGASATAQPAAVPPATGAAGQRVDMGQGKTSSAKPSGLEAGRLIAQQRFGKPAAAAQ